MRTILFVNQTAALGGAETSLFELAGALDPARHRGRAAGWKADGLPWVQE